jgi:hypothetical protein
MTKVMSGGPPHGEARVERRRTRQQREGVSGDSHDNE